MLYLRPDDLKIILTALNKHDEKEAHAALHRLILEFKYRGEQLDIWAEQAAGESL